MHALDLFLLFPFPSLLSRLLLGRATPELKALQQRFQQHWLHFVREGRPRDGWPAYDLEKRQTLLFNLSDQVVSDPQGERRRAWAGRDAPVR
jgi:para-nitrobenzyl esterase